MAEDKVEPRETNWRQLLPWTALFQGFRVARDLNKLALAAAGIVAMTIVWWLLAITFNYSSRPGWPTKYLGSAASPSEAWDQFKKDRQQWKLMHAAADPADSTEREEAEDLADNPRELTVLKLAVPKVAARAREGNNLDDIKADARRGRLRVTETVDGKDTEVEVPEATAVKAWQLRDPPILPAGKLRTWPWTEHRGSNPFLLVTGQAGRTAADGSTRNVPWEKGHFLEWMITEQGPVLVEPLVKLLEPIIYFFHPDAGLRARTYFLLVMLATVVIWSFFGGAITRIAAVQVARQEKIGIKEAVMFTCRRYLSFLAAPLFPLVLVALIVVVMILFGLPHMIPVVGDLIVDGLLWWLMVLLGLGMAVILIGLVGWPLMSATVSAEGTDFWEAVSRSYSYVFGAPWHYAFYSVVALLYGAVLVFFVGFMGSAAVYFAKWGVAQTPFIQSANREPSFLFVYAPTSFEWRTLLLQGVQIGGEPVVKDGRIQPEVYKRYVGTESVPPEMEKDQLTTYNRIGAVMVAFWLGVVFLLILGFGYSYFWSASTIIYLLMRRKVDDTEMDEVYLEEEDQDSLYGTAPFTPKPAAPAPAPAPTGASMTMVESPTLRTPPPPAAPAVPNEPPPAQTPPEPPATPSPTGGDGNPPAGG